MRDCSGHEETRTQQKRQSASLTSLPWRIMANLHGGASDRARQLASRFNIIIRTEDKNQMLLSLDTIEVTVDQVVLQVLKQNKLPMLQGANVSDILVTLCGSDHETHLRGWDWLGNLGISENEILLFTKQTAPPASTAVIVNRPTFQCSACQQTQARFWKRWEEGVMLCDVCWKRWREASRQATTSTTAAEPMHSSLASPALLPSSAPPTTTTDSSLENFSVQKEQHFGKEVHVITADSKRYIMQREATRHFGISKIPDRIPKTRLLGARVRFLLERAIISLANNHEAEKGVLVVPFDQIMNCIEERQRKATQAPTSIAKPSSASSSSSLSSRRDAIPPHMLTTIRALSTSRSSSKKIKIDS